ncbi:MAG: hypothetical protein HC802_04510 [Caldilineaceae bacterium]|nr:hypothetical protein [Caldilineaceae bacterium]
MRLATYAALFDDFPLDRMWRLTGVEHVLTWRRELFEPSELLAEFPQATDTTYLHRLTEPNPRAWLVNQVEVAADDEAARRLLADHSFDLEQIALLSEGEVGSRLDGDSTARTPSYTVALAQRGPASLHVELESDTGGLLLLAENWLPGWSVEDARCDAGPCESQPSPLADLPALSVERANLALIGVAVPPGAVAFDLVYRPQTLTIGAWISALTLLALTLLALVLAGAARWRLRRRAA